MSDKYVSHGNTYNGDGSSPDPATSDGGVGAWNDILAIMTAAPIYGTLTGGDTVHVRTQISGTDITISITADKTVLKRGSKDDGPIEWVFDDGTVWSGDSGILTIREDSDCSFIVDEYNIFTGKNKNLKILGNLTNAHHYDYLITKDHTVFREIALETESNTSEYVTKLLLIDQNSHTVFINCLLYERRFYSSGSYPFIDLGSYGSTVYFINCEFKTDFSSIDTPGLIDPNNLGGIIYIIGGKTTGMNSNRPFVRDTNTTWGSLSRVRFINFDLEGKVINSFGKTTDYTTDIYGVNLRNPYNSFYGSQRGFTEWERGNSYPVLNAELPDGTSWSYRIITQDDSVTYVTAPYSAVELLKLYADSPDTKKITVELLINQSISNPKKAEYFIEVGYSKDGGGYQVDVSEIDFTSVLETSSASWDTVSYGGYTYDKYKIELDTSENIRQYSMIAVRLFVGRAKVNDHDYIFVDPDITIGAV